MVKTLDLAQGQAATRWKRISSTVSKLARVDETVSGTGLTVDQPQVRWPRAHTTCSVASHRASKLRWSASSLPVTIEICREVPTRRIPTGCDSHTPGSMICTTDAPSPSLTIATRQCINHPREPVGTQLEVACRTGSRRHDIFDGPVKTSDRDVVSI